MTPIADREDDIRAGLGSQAAVVPLPTARLSALGFPLGSHLPPQHRCRRGGCQAILCGARAFQNCTRRRQCQAQLTTCHVAMKQKVATAAWYPGASQSKLSAAVNKTGSRFGAR